MSSLMHVVLISLCLSRFVCVCVCLIVCSFMMLICVLHPTDMETRMQSLWACVRAWLWQTQCAIMPGPCGRPSRTLWKTCLYVFMCNYISSPLLCCYYEILCLDRCVSLLEGAVFDLVTHVSAWSFACSPHVLRVFLKVLGFPPTVQK